MSEAYREAGVDIAKGNEAVQRMKKYVRTTFRPEVLTDLGGFGALFQLGKYKEPVLVSGTDGVGTKLKIAFALDKHDTVGIDLVAMSVNDIVVQGAEPLFFLDYIATGKIEPAKIEKIVAGIATGCKMANCALIGGETAEMPDMYREDEYDLAGFAVGAVEKGQLITGERIEANDVVIGLPSSGLHSNGFSLVRKIIAKHELALADFIPSLEKTLGEELITPTKIYVKTILSLLNDFTIKGMAHITGGGFLENIPRILPEGLMVKIELGSWPMLPIFSLLQSLGNLTLVDLYTTFNMGIGMVLIVNKEEVESIIAKVNSLGEAAYLIGKVVRGEKKVELVGVENNG